MIENIEDGEIVEGEVEEGELQTVDDGDDDNEMTAFERGTFPHCSQHSEDKQCIRDVLVKEHMIGKELNGCIMTFAPPHDRVQPKHVIYRSPDDEDLQFKRITHREDVLARCGRDVTFKRGGAFQSMASRKMVPIGSRVPQGEAPGDAYTPYAHMTSDTIEAINAMRCLRMQKRSILTRFIVQLCNQNCVYKTEVWLVLINGTGNPQGSGVRVQEAHLLGHFVRCMPSESIDDYFTCGSEAIKWQETIPEF
ncbi:hypothetical protein BC629DRAFT_1446481 [Irpex lacteus]|nr:hypothetical protein BC629DRAFT_1446481 [Irpex lacteus]